MSPRGIYTLDQLQTLARYAAALRDLIRNPDTDEARCSLTALVLEKDLVRRMLFKKCKSLTPEAKESVLGIMRDRAPNKEKKKKKSVKPAYGAWGEQQKKDLAEWRKMGLFYQRM